MTVRERYNSYAKHYDLVSLFVEPLFRKYKRRILKHITNKVLEVGVGTGVSLQYYNFKNIMYYGIDISENMLEKAKNRFNRVPDNVISKVGNIEKLDFPPDEFDYIISSDVFCSIYNPIRGFKEIRRVLKNSGKYIAFENVKSKNKIIGKVMDLANLIITNYATNINREIVEYMKKAGLRIILDKNIHLDIIKVIIATK